MPSYFEITVSSRQLALAVAAVVALALAAFGLGVVVGIQEPATVASLPPGTVAVAPEPRFVPSVDVGAAPDVVGALRGEDGGTVPAAALPAAVDTGSTAAPASGGAGVGPTEPAWALPATEPLPTPVPATEPPPTSLPTRPAVTPSATEFPLPRLGRGVWVQVGALTAETGAQSLRRRVMQLGYTPTQVVVQAGGDGKYRVRVGPFPDEESAGRVVARLRADGFPGAFTVKE